MDTIKILLGVTVALLVGALAMSWKDFRHDERNTPKDELAEVQRQIDEIRREQERLRLERERIMLDQPSAPPPQTEPTGFAPADVAPDPVVPSPAPSAASDPPPVFADPSELDLGPPVPSEAELNERAAAIANAPVVATIAEWVADPEIGTFATLDVLEPASVQKGSVLCLRRNTGILGRLKVNDVSPEGAVAAALSQFGELTPEPGDELIVEPGTE